MRFAPAVAVALRATLRAAKLHPHCASHREAATRFACANIQNSRRACGGSSLTIPCSSSHFVHTSGGNCSQPMQCMPHLWRSHRRQIREHNIAVGRYVMMPDHVHLFVRGPDDFQLGPWVGMLKQALAKHIALARTSPIWQRGFFDHVLRNDESYGDKWNYVRENPVRAGLVTKADDWPYSGEIVVIDRA